MALHVQASFAAGELDPALQERTTLDKFQSGLETARNVVVAKTGRVISRGGRVQFALQKTSGAANAIKLYSPPMSGILTEWGAGYVRGYSINGPFQGQLLWDTAHALTQFDVPNMHFDASTGYVYCISLGNPVLKLNYSTGAFIAHPFQVQTYGIPIITKTANTGTGYLAEYFMTFVVNGQEGFTNNVTNAYQLPINNGEVTTFTGEALLTSGTITEMRVYRRPHLTGAFGYIGNATVGDDTTNAGYMTYTFTDYGAAADYTHNPPNFTLNGASTSNTAVTDYSSYKTGAIYQQRLILASALNDSETIVASRTGLQNNYTADSPLADDSALTFKAGSSGIATVLRMVENDGLVVFTTVGVYLSVGALGIDNLALSRKGNWVVDDAIPPIAIPGAVLFVDVSTNCIRQLIWSTEAQSYAAEELSIYSNHLFVGRKIVSWAFQQGAVPILFAVFNDGAFASFTLNPEQQMRAWTRGDSALPVEYVCGTGFQDQSFFVVNNNGTRSIEMTIPRYILQGARDVNGLLPWPGGGSKFSYPPIDSMVMIHTYLNNGLLLDGSQFIVAPLVANAWNGQLRLTSGTSNVFINTYVGKTFRYFDPTAGWAIDMLVVSVTGPRECIVQPNMTFPSSAATGLNLTLCSNTFSGLSHMEGEFAQVVIDGYVYASPNNDDQNYAKLQVINGTITLPNGRLGAWAWVGRPYVMDAATLQIDTVEQRPVLVESLTVNKVYTKVLNSSALYVGSEFPANNKVKGMQSMESMEVNYADPVPIIGNTYQKPLTKRIEMTLPGSWKSRGRVCIRQVDPLHFEILSIIPDVEDMRRR